jgi:hypothetical protein
MHNVHEVHSRIRKLTEETLPYFFLDKAYLH